MAFLKVKESSNWLGKPLQWDEAPKLFSHVEIGLGRRFCWHRVLHVEQQKQGHKSSPALFPHGKTDWRGEVGALSPPAVVFCAHLGSLYFKKLVFPNPAH